jgi:hypothetical protein
MIKQKALPPFGEQGFKKIGMLFLSALPTERPNSRYDHQGGASDVFRGANIPRLRGVRKIEITHGVKRGFRQSHREEAYRARRRRQEWMCRHSFQNSLRGGWEWASVLRIWQLSANALCARNHLCSQSQKSD